MGLCQNFWFEVTPEAQQLHIAKYNHWWSLNAKKVKRSVRSRLRWNEEQWCRNVEQCCLAMYVVAEAKRDKRVTDSIITAMLRGFTNGFLDNKFEVLKFKPPIFLFIN